MLENLKGLLGGACACEDSTLNALLETATDTILDYIGREELPSRLESVVVQYAVILYNQMGAEGETSRSQGGVNQSFLNDLPPAMQRRLINYPRKVRVIHGETDTELA